MSTTTRDRRTSTYHQDMECRASLHHIQRQAKRVSEYSIAANEQNELPSSLLHIGGQSQSGYDVVSAGSRGGGSRFR